MTVSLSCRHDGSYAGYRPAPWHFLYLRPEPQGQGSLRPTSGTAAVARPTGPIELFTAGARMGDAGAGAGEPIRRDGPVKRSSAPTGAGVGAGGGGILRACGSG